MNKILFLCRKHYFSHRLSRVRFHAVEAIGRLCEVIWSGPEWGNWKDGDVEKICGGKPDFIIVYRPFEIKDFDKIGIPCCGLYDELDTNDNLKENTIREIRENKIDLVISHQRRQMDAPEFKELPCKFVHIPYCAEKSIFKDYGLPKDIDVLLVGNLGAKRYPFRDRLYQLIKKMKGDPQYAHYNLGVFPFPGYRIPDADSNKEAIKFAQWMNRSKICITGCGIHHLKYAKYVEIPMCRSLLMADIPGEDQDFLTQFMAPINRDDTDDAIIEKMVYYLENDKERNRLTDKGYELTLENYTQDHYARKFVQEIETYLKENHGKKRW